MLFVTNFTCESNLMFGMCADGVCAVQTGLINGLERGLEVAYEQDPCSPCVGDMNNTSAH